MRLFLASLVLALAGCASVGTNGPLANEANIIAGVQAAADLGQALYNAHKMTDAEATSAISAFRAIQNALVAADSAMEAGDKASSAVYLRAAADALDALMAQLAAIQKKG